MFYPEDSETYEHLSRRQNIIGFIMLLFCFLLIVYMTIEIYLYDPVRTIFFWLPLASLCVSLFAFLLQVLLQIIKPFALTKLNRLIMNISFLFLIIGLVIFVGLGLISLL